MTKPPRKRPSLLKSRRSLDPASPASVKKAIDPQALNQKRVDDLVDRDKRAGGAMTTEVVTTIPRRRAR